VFTFWFGTCRRTPSSSGRRYPVLWNPILVGKSSTHTLTHSRREIYDLQVRQSQNDNKINRTFAWYLASFCLPVICANAMQFVGPTFEPVAELPYFGLRFFWRSGSRDPRKKSTWNWYTCRQVSREFYIFNCRASKCRISNFDGNCNWFIFSIIFTHASTSAIRPNASADFTRLKLRQRQRDDGHKNTAHQTQKTLNTLQSRAGSLKRWFKGGNWMVKRGCSLWETF